MPGGWRCEADLGGRWQVAKGVCVLQRGGWQSSECQGAQGPKDLSVLSFMRPLSHSSFWQHTFRNSLNGTWPGPSSEPREQVSRRVNVLGMKYHIAMMRSASLGAQPS